ncbi:hypothetical protein [Tenacibaculum phage Larrie]|nr:hypothetical protein [Tenacibaculum phage Larrie]
MNDELREIIIQFLESVKKELDEFTSEKGHIETSGDSVSLFTPHYIQFAKYGRGAGKMPPIEPLVDWVKRKGIVSEDSQARGTAFAIAKSISKKGTLNHVPNAPNAIEEAMENALDSYTINISGYFSDEINNAVLDMVVNALPSDWDTETKVKL